MDLSSRTVSTLAGDGSQGGDYAGGGRGASQKLSSPWAVAMDAGGEAVFVAMAGTHQVCRQGSDDANRLAGLANFANFFEEECFWLILGSKTQKSRRTLSGHVKLLCSF